MSSRSQLNDQEWAKILAFLRQHPKVHVGSQRNCRRFVEAVLWILRTGAQWRELPPSHGKWNSVFKRFNRWSQQGVWKDLLDVVQQDAELQLALIDSTIVRAHACAAGASKK
ncbi:MAG: IS5 family transposase [Candidatus Competibacteraceae bacterium]|nr:IS5 family transposase [Candidatus Competibacteraceae bacterium]